MLARASTPDCNLRVVLVPTGSLESWLHVFKSISNCNYHLLNNEVVWNPSTLEEKDFNGSISFSFMLGSATATSTLTDFDFCEIDLDPMELLEDSALLALHSKMSELASIVKGSVGFSGEGKTKEPIFAVEPDGTTKFYIERIPEPYV